MPETRHPPPCDGAERAVDGHEHERQKRKPTAENMCVCTCMRVSLCVCVSLSVFLGLGVCVVAGANFHNSVRVSFFDVSDLNVSKQNKYVCACAYACACVCELCV